MSTSLREEATRLGVAEDLSGKYAEASFATYLGEFMEERVKADAALFAERFEESLRQLFSDRRAAGRSAGEARAYRRILRHLVANTGMSLPEAMDAIGMPEEDRGKYLHLRSE